MFKLYPLSLTPSPPPCANGTGGLSSSNIISFLIPAPIEPPETKIELYSPQYYAACTEQGVRGLFRGWAPKLVGYSAQGACKFGFYEYFKKYYSDIAGPEYVLKYKTLIYLAALASVEFIADIALCPFEAVKLFLRIYCSCLLKHNGAVYIFSNPCRLYKGFVPLWGRQILCKQTLILVMTLSYYLNFCLICTDTMMQFASFETIVEMLYKYAIPTPKNECSKPLQLAVSFAGGYVAGVFCAIVSHPADNLVSCPSIHYGHLCSTE
ncbi:hypothetical protein RHMOL_Rhmol10G0002800 [Rhododendron molle]|uniref:Uncharacterized protein n=1 Tax=Rhododendron molle TaxID=49168 RepID=A0ACC0LXF0_RHOML|nr:hypothetical protein RHMOL_Rhmol10G0002800 [Rhododendron molle]